ncbi:MAG: transposase [Christensenellales bacterium]
MAKAQIILHYRPNRPSCFDKSCIRRRILASGCYPAFYRGHERTKTSEYLSMMRLRKIWAEGSFSVLKREHQICKIRKWGIANAREECFLSALALNVKRMVNAIRFMLFSWNKTDLAAVRKPHFVNRSLI